ncbi:MAG: peptidase [Rhizobacter sp.]|nr:peptidase [Rhizobacter sp.]
MKPSSRKRSLQSLLPALTIVVSVLAPHFGARAGSVEIPAQVSGAMSVPVTSLKEARFRSTLRQQYDFSCGSAAVATLLTHHYRTPVDEKTAFESMYSHGNAETIRREGFSLLDMKDYLATLGFEADGFEAPIQALATARIPGIVLINEHGYNHFVVVKGLQDGRVLLGDPAGGTRAMSIAAFEAVWANRIVFVIGNRTELARFNDATDWSAAPRAPLGPRSGLDSGSAANWSKLGSSDF